MNSMLFACGGMRQGKHHLYDGVDDQGSERNALASNTFKTTIHKRIGESFGGTLSRARDEGLGPDSEEDIRDEDFDTE